MQRTPHVLVVDDHKEIRDLLAKYLAKNGLRVSTANGGAEMRQQLRTATIDLVVLDIMMPGEDGLSLCRSLRQTSMVPIVLLTAVSDETDRIIGLELGADDYVTKPFNPRELLARIRALLRRANATASVTSDPDHKRYRFANWTLDVSQRSLVDASGSEAALGTAEFRLLLALVSRPGVVLTRNQLLDITAGRSAQVFDRSIDNLVSRLRRRIEDDPQQPTLIKTVWGDGYTFAGTVEEVS
ncbi:response regulator [Agrobacterium rhizogenes]|uniref:Regulatory protein VirG n=2 Tax=Rhizobium rhizogenes TaxID=359 RepID=B9JKB7_RHIR8|nr:response regulator [Rhizobium rhizogenes]ACM30359.1 two-component response regulator protein [Rhizobium rhizogenes K84]OCJ01841.1 DNA-binding response regulator [Agrobacterium sp. 13-626]OCJ15714.1 DNA-binding response regulator [Agrobacterium sp. B131/95]OCJ19554.1 DNA-binding response regulator [Agrobacterium sp. B133/95]KEA08911.1 chemotaxis protein CheY [Rhizobium rhizogenes]